MTAYDLSFTIREIRTAHLAFPDTPGLLGAIPPPKRSSFSDIVSGAVRI